MWVMHYLLSCSDRSILNTTNSGRKNQYRESIIKCRFFDSDSLFWKWVGDFTTVEKASHHRSALGLGHSRRSNHYFRLSWHVIRRSSCDRGRQPDDALRERYLRLFRLVLCRLTHVATGSLGLCSGQTMLDGIANYGLLNTYFIAVLVSYVC